MAKARQTYAMDESELVAILREENTSATGYFDSELALAQTEAMERYLARPYGDEMEGRSHARTHDVSDTVNWLVPHLMRLFVGNDDLLTVEDVKQDEPEILQNIGTYLSHVVFKENAGEEIIHDLCVDGLIQRVGVARVAWEDPIAKPPKTYRNIPNERLAEFINNPEFEIVGQSEENGLWELEIVVTPQRGRVVVEQVPPEEFAFSSQAKSIEGADYHRRKSEEYAAELAEQFPDSADELLSFSPRSARSARDYDNLDSDPRKLTRHAPESLDSDETENDYHARQTVTLLTEYIRVDFDGDGIVELRQIKRVDNLVLENVIVDKSEFVSWSPIRLAHKLAGRSIADTLLDLQQIRTVITRKLLDSLGQSLAPRRIVNKNKLGEAGVDQLLDHDIGDVIECEGDPNDAVHELITPDVSPSAYQALSYMDQRVEEASGVTKHAQGLKAEAITDTAQGINALQTAANSRIELIGRWLGASVERIFMRVYELSLAHQHGEIEIPVGGRPVSVNPQTWSEDARIELHVGAAAETRNEKLQKLNMISSKQEQILLQMGPNNPLVTLKQYRETLAQMTREAGYRNPEKFFQEINAEQPPEPPKPDPEVEKAKAEMQMQQAKMQADQQLAQMKAQADAQLAQAKAQADVQLEQAKLQASAEMERMKAQAKTQEAVARFEFEKELQAAKLQSEREIAEIRIASEQELAYARMEQEKEIALEQIEISAKTKIVGGAISAGNRPGGALDA